MNADEIAMDVQVPLATYFRERPRNGIYKGPDYIGAGAKLVRMGDLFTFDKVRSDWDGFQLVTLSESELGRSALMVNDLLFCRTSVAAKGVGKCSIVEKADEDMVAASNLIRIRLDAERADALFFFYFFSSDLGCNRVRSKTRGAAVFTITAGDIGSVEVPAWPLPTQRKIAAVLSAYDDLIENNNRRIKLLEEMAQRIYREWFVEFRYPGHEEVPLVDSELGPIPEGWEVGSIGEHADVIRGRSYRGADVVDEGGLPFVNLKCVARDGGFRVDGIKRYVGDFKEPHKARPGDIVMAVTDMTQERRIVAHAARVPPLEEEFGVFSMDLVKVAPTDLPSEYVLGLFSYSGFPDQVKDYANGANVLHLHPDRISEYRFAVPPRAIASRYAQMAGPTLELSDALQSATARLSAARDLLLPRLISGEVDVTDLDIAMPEAA